MQREGLKSSGMRGHEEVKISGMGSNRLKAGQYFFVTIVRRNGEEFERFPNEGSDTMSVETNVMGEDLKENNLIFCEVSNILNEIYT